MNQWGPQQGYGPPPAPKRGMSGAAIGLIVLGGLFVAGVGCVTCLAVVGAANQPKTATGGPAKTSGAGGDACYLLNDLGLRTRGWKNTSGTEWMCSSDYKELFGTPPATIAYYVKGTNGQAESAKLVLSVWDRSEEGSARGELAIDGDALIRGVTGEGMPVELSQPLALGKNATRGIGKRTVTVRRTDWPTGKGYEIELLIWL